METKQSKEVNVEERKKLYELFRKSGQANFQVFLDGLIKEHENVIDATEAFEQKKKLDTWWELALKRVNDMGEVE